MKYSYHSFQLFVCCLQLGLSEQTAAEAKYTILSLLLKEMQQGSKSTILQLNFIYNNQWCILQEPFFEDKMATQPELCPTKSQIKTLLVLQINFKSINCFKACPVPVL